MSEQEQVVGIIGVGMVDLNFLFQFNVPFIALFEDVIKDDALPLTGRWLALPSGVNYATLDNILVMDVKTFEIGRVNFGRRTRVVFQHMGAVTSIFKNKGHQGYMGELTGRVNSLVGTPLDKNIESVQVK